MTLHDLEWRNGPYFALVHRIRVRCRRKKFTFAISSPDELFVSRCREQNIRSLDVSFTIANDYKYSEVYFPKLPLTATSSAFHASYEIILYM